MEELSLLPVSRIELNVACWEHSFTRMHNVEHIFEIKEIIFMFNSCIPTFTVILWLLNLT
jgi:hypothetical protein